MPRFDSYISSSWVSSTVLTGLQADGTLLASFTFIRDGDCLPAVVASSDVAWAYTVALISAAGATKAAQLFQPAAGNEQQFFPAPVSVAAGDTLRATLTGAVTPIVGLQLSLFPMILG